MRANPSRIGRALADRLRRHDAFRAISARPGGERAMPDGDARQASPAGHTRPWQAPVRVTPYLLRRGGLW